MSFAEGLGAISSNSPSKSALDWRIIAEREAVGRVDTWDEYLCLAKSETEWLVGVCSYSLLGEIPQEWLDDEGQPRPPYAEEDGSLRPPEIFGGESVTGHDGQYILGALNPVNDYAVVAAPTGTLHDIAAALREIGWEDTDSATVQAAISHLSSHN